MELKVTCCDFCNPNGDLHPRDGRGLAVYAEVVAVSEMDWKRMPDGKVMCIECQEEKGLI
jgi:hypothetical protein